MENKVKGSERLLKGKTEPHTDGYMTAEQTEDCTECAKEYEELGLKELKELINADRKSEPQTEGE